MLVIKRLFAKNYREIIAPISKDGIDLVINSSNDFDWHKNYSPTRRPENISLSTIIIKGGQCVWDFEIPNEIRKRVVDLNLKFDTIRTHGLLHTPPMNKNLSASIYVNDQLVDKIYLVKEHPHGEDLGVDSRRPFPIIRFINKHEEKQIVRVNLDKGVCWDIDRVSLEPIIVRNELRPWVYMIIGAIISTLTSIITTLINK